MTDTPDAAVGARHIAWLRERANRPTATVHVGTVALRELLAELERRNTIMDHARRAMDAMHFTDEERKIVLAVLYWSDAKPDAEHMARYEDAARARRAGSDTKP